MDPETGTPQEVVEAEKLQAEIDRQKLDGWVNRYEKSIHTASVRKENTPPVARAIITLTREFFDVIGQTPMLNAADNREYITQSKKEEAIQASNRHFDAKAATIKDRFR